MRTARHWQAAWVIFLLGAAVGAEPPKGEYDPFSDENLAVKQPGPGPRRGGTADLIDFQVEVSPKTVRPGETVKVTITGEPKPGYWTYPITRRTSKQLAVGLSRLNYKPSNAFQPLWPIQESEPVSKPNALGEPELKFPGKFTWTQDVLVKEDAPRGTQVLAFNIDLQVCDDRRCVPGTHPYELTVEVAGDPQPLSDELKKRAAVPEPMPSVIEVESKTDTSPPPSTGGAKKSSDTGLWAFVLQGVFWGGVSLITPCVFPMIPITVSFFLKQSEKERHRPVMMALVYCTTIVVVLTIAAVALLSTFRELSTHWLMNFGLGALFVFFALSLFGMYEIELPSGLAQFTQSKEGSGMVGTVFMALTFTIISFACVAPFLGGFGGTAATQNLGFGKILLGGLAFSVTFASPFFLLALFPTLLKKMPKSGSWLNSVKVVMGFLELAAALKFLRQGELRLSSEPSIFTYDFVLALYVAISLLCGLYLLAVYRLPHDTPVENIGVMRMIVAMLFIGLGFYLLPAVWKTDERGNAQRPRGAVFAWLDSFLLPEHVEAPPPGKANGSGEAEALRWLGTLEKGLTVAREKNNRVFIDFTGKTCTNCKFNERAVFPRPEVRELMQQYVLVALYTDQVPNDLYPPDVRQGLGRSIDRQEEDAKKNLAFQREKFGTEQLPLYVIVEPDGTGGWREVDRYDEGKINNVAEFVDFLRRNLPK